MQSVNSTPLSEPAEHSCNRYTPFPRTYGHRLADVNQGQN